ncbi:hypothetical protein ACFX15_002647 [Malus domestica]
MLQRRQVSPMLSFGWKVWPKRTQNGVVSGGDDHPHGRGSRASSRILDLGPARVLCSDGVARIFSLEDEEAAVAPGHVGHMKTCVLEIASRVGDSSAD